MCLLADTCNHTWIPQCATETKDERNREFRDTCDMYEYNCDFHKNFHAVDYAVCHPMLSCPTCPPVKHCPFWGRNLRTPPPRKGVRGTFRRRNAPTVKLKKGRSTTKKAQIPRGRPTLSTSIKNKVENSKKVTHKVGKVEADSDSDFLEK